MKNKNIVKKFRYYPMWLYSKLDNWLNKMSLQGYHLIDYNSFCYTFEKGDPKNTEYFSCEWGGFRNDDGYYNVLLRHPFAEEVYGKKKSKLTKNRKHKMHSFLIMEINKEKISGEIEIGYKELISDRNKYHLKKAIKFTAIFSIIIVFMCVLAIAKYISWTYAIIIISVCLILIALGKF